MNRQERRDRRLARAKGYRDAAHAQLADVEHTQHQIKNRGHVSDKLRALGYEGRVIRGYGWWELWQGGRAPVGSAEHVDGVLHVYAPAPDDSAKPPEQPPRKADPRYRRVTVSRALVEWDAWLTLAGFQRRAGEGINEAMRRAQNSQRFRGLVK